MATGSSFAADLERAMYDYSASWEGIAERVIDYGDALLRTSYQSVVRLSLDERQLETRLDTLIAAVEHEVNRSWWVIGPSTSPLDLSDRLRARRFSVAVEWDGLVLDGLAQEMPHNPDIVIEHLAESNVEGFALCPLSNDEIDRFARRLANAKRYLAMTPKEVQIWVARLDGTVVGYGILRLEKNHLAYLADAFTAPRFRGRGVYKAPVAHRLAVAKEAGCTAAMTFAITSTSAPILRKRGFTLICRLAAYASPESAAH